MNAIKVLWTLLLVWSWTNVELSRYIYTWREARPIFFKISTVTPRLELQILHRTYYGNIHGIDSSIYFVFIYLYFCFYDQNKLKFICTIISFSWCCILSINTLRSLDVGSFTWVQRSLDTFTTLPTIARLTQCYQWRSLSGDVPSSWSFGNQVVSVWHLRYQSSKHWSVKMTILGKITFLNMNFLLDLGVNLAPCMITFQINNLAFSDLQKRDWVLTLIK